MSNLLIGIIGVALFIGLALGAAIFLGPRFDDAQNNALASDSLAAVAQIASAVNSYRLATGYNQGTALSSVQALVDAGFLRDVPKNTAYAGAVPQIVDSTGVDAANSSSSAVFQPAYVMMSIGSNQDLCTLVERKEGSISSSATASSTSIVPSSTNLRNGGCFRSSNAATGIAAGDYVVFARV